MAILTSKFNPSVLATTGMGIILLDLCGFLFLSVSTPVFILIILLILLGVGFGLFSSPNANVIRSSIASALYEEFAYHIYYFCNFVWNRGVCFLFPNKKNSEQILFFY